MLKIAFVDDDKESIETYSQYAKKVLGTDRFCVFDTFSSPLNFIDNYKSGYDVLFLDIMMPGINGLDVARKIRKIDSNVTIVFITTLARCAINGYEVGAFDYVLKPCSYDDFEVRFRRVLHYIENNKNTNEKITIKTKDCISIINVNDIVFIESDAHYLTYHTIDDALTQRETLKEAVEKLDSTRFSSCNKCYLINLRFVEKIDDLFVYLAGGTKIQVSRLKKKSFIQALTNYYLKG